MRILDVLAYFFTFCHIQLAATDSHFYYFFDFVQVVVFILICELSAGQFVQLFNDDLQR